MRIVFPNSAREAFPWAQAELTIGSAPDNHLVLAAGQAADHHLRIRLDRRGWVLRVLPEAGRIYLNARPVRERALLRAGDILSVGDCRMLLCADDAPDARKPVASDGHGRCTAALRAVAGPLTGRVLGLEDGLELGPHGAHPLELPQGGGATLRVHWRDGVLRADLIEASDAHPLRLNGIEVTAASLQPGDQLGLGMHRFVIEAPGLVRAPSPAPAVPPAPVHLPEEDAGPRGEVWWLIVTAAVIALGIAVLLLVRF